MAKAKTSKRQKDSSKNTLKEFKLNESLFLDRKLIAEVLTDAIIDNDLETLRDVLIAHIKTVSKVDLAKKTGLARKTIYNLISDGKFDPRLSTLSVLLSKLAA